MYYIQRGIPNARLGKTLAMAFAFFGMCAALLGTGNMAQSNTVEITQDVSTLENPAILERLKQSVS